MVDVSEWDFCLCMSNLTSMDHTVTYGCPQVRNLQLTAQKQNH